MIAPHPHPLTATTIKAKIALIQAQIARLETLRAVHQTEFQTAQEPDRPEHLIAEMLRITADLMSAQETSARLECELAALRSKRSQRPWWWRIFAG